MKAYRSKKAEKNIIRTYNELLDQWGIPVKEIMIPTSFGAAHAIIAGKEDGKPLLLFHGVGDDSALMWIYNAKCLGEHFRLYAIDTIGGPGKSLMSEKYNAGFDDVSWIDEIIHNLEIEKPSLIGVSHGGYLVQLYSIFRQEKIDKAISMAASVPIGESGNPLKMMMKIFLPEALIPTKGNVMRIMRKLSGAHAEVYTDSSLIMEHYTWLLKGFNNMAMRYHKIRAFTEEEVIRIRDKVFYLVGLEDPFEKLGGAKALRDNGMKVRFFEGVGHGINHEISVEINELLIDILEDKVVNL